MMAGSTFKQFTVCLTFGEGIRKMKVKGLISWARKRALATAYWAIRRFQKKRWKDGRFNDAIHAVVKVADGWLSVTEPKAVIEELNLKPGHKYVFCEYTHIDDCEAAPGAAQAANQLARAIEGTDYDEGQLLSILVRAQNWIPNTNFTGLFRGGFRTWFARRLDMGSKKRVCSSGVAAILVKLWKASYLLNGKAPRPLGGKDHQLIHIEDAAPSDFANHPTFKVVAVLDEQGRWTEYEADTSLS